jgi:hypothetical protein
MTSPRRKKIKLKKWLAKSPSNIVRYMDKLDILIGRRRAELARYRVRRIMVKYNTNGRWISDTKSPVVTDADFAEFLERYS